MSSLNKVFLIGRLGQDPEMKYTPTGLSVVTFSVATSKKWKDKQSGNPQEKTAWHRVQAWGEKADLCHRFLKKGSLIHLEGELEYSQTEKDGVKKYFTAIVLQQIQFLTPKDDKSPGELPASQPNGFDDNSQYGGTNFQGGPNPPPASQSNFANDNIPF